MRRPRRLLAVVGLGALVGLLVLPTGAVGALLPPTASTPHGPPAGPTARGAPPSTAFPGATPSGVFVDAPQMYRSDGTQLLSELTTRGSGPSNDSEPPGAPAVRPVAAGPAAPRSWVSGTVVDSVKLTPVDHATVSTSAPSGACGTCSVVYSTNASGEFLVPAPSGAVIVSVNTTGYEENQTFATVAENSTTNLGTIDLVHVATVEGTVVADLPGAPPVPGVQVQSASRDGGLIGPEVAVTNASGGFVLAVDPLPIALDLEPGLGLFLPNETFLDPAPWANLSVGTIALEGGVMLNVTVVDALTGAGVANASVAFCSERIDSTCLGVVTGGPGSIAVPSVAGDGIFVASAPGYVTNSTPAPNVPTGTAGPVDDGTIDLVPDGAVQVTVNVTGGSPNGTWPVALPGETSTLLVLACSLSGESPGIPLPDGLVPPNCLGTAVHTGVTVDVPAPPLRDAVFVVRDLASDPVPVGFPLGEVTFRWDSMILPYLRMLNVTWANVTPGETTNVGSVNIDPGTYLSGALLPPPTIPSSLNVSATVTVCSTVVTDECEPSVATGPSGPSLPVAKGCPTAAWTFCAPAAPGPDVVQIRWGPVTNGTWVTVPPGCCGQQGRPTPIGTFALSDDLGVVHGTVTVAGAPAGTVPAAGLTGGITVCPAAPGEAACLGGPFDPATGAFDVPAQLGWDKVTASAQYYRANATWVDVTENNSTGAIALSPNAVVEGSLVSAATGLPIAEAQVEACPVVTPEVCLAVATSASSAGTYNGTLPALPYPASAYQFEATASGFDPESTFANVTPGGLVVVPTLRLAPVGSLDGAPLAPHAGSSSTPTTGSWVTGRLLDGSTGLGAGNAVIQVCPLSGTLGCPGTPTLALDDGGFNLSTVHGAYELWINSSQYATDRVYVNATTAGTVSLGDLNLTPLPRVTGRIAVGPWPSLLALDGMGADQAILHGCDPSGTCGPLAVADSAGFFNASVPLGTPDRITLVGNGADDSGNGDTGYAPVIATLDIVPGTQVLAGAGPDDLIDLPILGGWSGTLLQVGGTSASPAGFTSFGSSGNASAGSPVIGRVGPGGNYTAFLPGGANPVQLEAQAESLAPAVSSLPNAAIAAGIVAPGPSLNLSRYGAVTLRIQAALTDAPLDGVGVVASGQSAVTGLALNASSASNGTGAVVLLAPPGYDTFVAGGVAYGNWSGTESVGSGTTVALGTVNLTVLADGGLVTVRTEEVNDVGVPPRIGVRDNASGGPVVGLFVSEQVLGGGAVGPVYGNDLGQFLLEGYPDRNANVTIQAPGYAMVSIGAALPVGTTKTMSGLNLTPDGIVAGTVEALPGNASVPYASVVICPVADPTCGNVVETNESGVFWAAAPAGLDAVSVESNIYLTNLSRVVTVPAGGFVRLGAIPVFSFATVHGSVRGLPSGSLVPGASVSLCSPFSPPNACLPDVTVTTDANGSFSIQSPPGEYVLAASAPGANVTRYTLLLTPGEDLDVGTVFLEANGVVDGTVVAASGGPIADATVLACGTWSGSSCAAPVATSPTGTFSVETPPGPTDLTVVASGYLDGETVVAALSGATIDVAPIVLTPVPPDVPENVTGSVVTLTTGTPLSEALVVAWENGVRTAQTLTLPNGSFRLEVRWGTVTVYTGLAGYTSANATFVVHAPVSGVDFRLSLATYGVHGVAFDGGTGAGVAGVAIAKGVTVLTDSGPDGAFSLALPNGTTELTASLATGGVVQYRSVPFTVTVQGAATVADVTLPRSVVPLDGVVVDAQSGAAVPDASVVLWSGTGTALRSAATDSAGAFAFGVAPATYNVSVSAAGYGTANVTVGTGPAGNHTAIALLRLAPLATTAARVLPLSWIALGAGAVILAALLVVVLLRRGRRPGAARGAPVEAEYRVVEGPTT
jgi:hypothetical protein